jgi:hypothetical protein
MLTLAFAGAAFAQETKTTTTTQVTKTVQNPDGTYTVIEYPVDKEVTVSFDPSAVAPSAKGIARVKRTKAGTLVHLDVTGLTGDVTNYNLYGVDPNGKVTLFGPVAVNNGVATYETTTPMTQFMMFLSPESDLATFGPDTNVILRSTAPEGLAVIPLRSSGERDGAAVGEKVAATTTTGATPAYNVPMLGIPGYRRGTDTEVKINLSGPMTGSRANISLEPRKDGPTTIKMRFHELKEAPAGQTYVVWAVSPDNKFSRIGQIVNTGKRNEAEIQTETALLDFGLFITAEATGDVISPSGVIIGTVEK